MQCDVLVVGAGGAGLMAAIAAKEAGADVLVLTKEYPTRSQTCMAQGGINAVLGNADNDSVELHIQNTLQSAHGLADMEAVRFMCEQAPKTIAYLDAIGVCFSRTQDGKIAQRRLGGAGVARACYAQDYTGLKILHTLYDRCNALGVEFVNDTFLLDLLQERDGAVVGAKVLDIRTSEIKTYLAKSTILATGGYSKIYGKFSTNSKASSGDGIAVALRAGAKLKEMEFVQFHPTGLKNSSILISESARGEGGYLLNCDGQRFCNELAPRDEVSRAIDAEIKRGKEVFLDIRHLTEAFIDENLPQERKLAKLYEDVDPVFELIPIKPVAHYTMGGIAVDNRSQTTLPNLFACGECANHSVHGANRLGGNSLLEIVVFGREAGRNAAQRAKEIEQIALPENKGCFLQQSFSNEINFYEQKERLGKLMYEKVGIVRNKQQLQEALQEVQTMDAQLVRMGWDDTNEIYNTNKQEFLEFRNAVTVAIEVIQAALFRDESCGAHFMEEQ